MIGAVTYAKGDEALPEVLPTVCLLTSLPAHSLLAFGLLICHRPTVKITMEYFISKTRSALYKFHKGPAA